MENQFKIYPKPRSTIQLGNKSSEEEVKNSYVSTYNFVMKPNNPEPFNRISKQNSSSIVLDIPSKNADYRSEAMLK